MKFKKLFFNGNCSSLEHLTVTKSTKKVDKQCTVSISSVGIALFGSSYSYHGVVALYTIIFLVVITDTGINKKT